MFPISCWSSAGSCSHQVNILWVIRQHLSVNGNVPSRHVCHVWLCLTRFYKTQGEHDFWRLLLVVSQWRSLRTSVPISGWRNCLQVSNMAYMSGIGQSPRLMSEKHNTFGAVHLQECDGGGGGIVSIFTPGVNVSGDTRWQQVFTLICTYSSTQLHSAINRLRMVTRTAHFTLLPTRLYYVQTLSLVLKNRSLKIRD